MALSGSGIGQRFEAEVEALIGVIGLRVGRRLAVGIARALL